MNERVKNVEYKGITRIEGVNEGFPSYKLTDVPADKWNSMAEKANTKAFVKKFGRDPVDHHELMVWVYSLVPFNYVPEKYKKSRTAVTVSTHELKLSV